MMIESSFLCSSSWDSDLFRDYEPVADIPSMLEFDDYACSLERENSKMSSCPTTPNDLSSNSSDYEGFDLDNILPLSDSFVSQILEEDNAIGFSDLDWSPFPESPKKNTSTSDCRTTPMRNSIKKTTKSIENLSSKSWSKMSSEEQLQTLHDLSEIVTRQMGIREQIEVIKIIDPSAVISPEDKEFALDCSILSDVKLKKIRDFLKKQRFHVTNSFKSLGRPSHVTNPVKTSHSTKLLSKKASSSSYSRTKRRQKKQKIQSFENKRIQRKLQRQGKKEEQSGLFVYEKMIKKLSNPMEEDEDVNILE